MYPAPTTPGTWRAPLPEGPRPLLRVLARPHAAARLLERRERGPGRRRAVGDRVHGELRRGHGERSVGGNGLEHELRLVVEALGRDEPVDEAHLEGPRRLHGLSAEEQLAGERRADGLHESGHAARLVEDAELRRGHLEARRLGGDAQVAGDREVAARARGDAVHLRHDRHSQRSDAGAEALGGPGGASRAVDPVDVEARAERRAGPCQDDDTGLRVRIDAVERLERLLDQLGSDGVALRRAVQRQTDDVAVLLDDQLAGHSTPTSSGERPAASSTSSVCSPR